MKEVISTEKVPIKSWVTGLEMGALEQAKNLANLPFVFKHIALMPDCHQGFGMPIGGVLAVKGVVIPNAVGVDIGCGMCAMKTHLKVEDLDIDSLKKIMGEIRKTIPVGFKHHQIAKDENLMPKVEGDIKDYPVVSKEYGSALSQIGTLGGGNHFIEIQKGDDGFVWVMIHSGSRNIGKKVADYYNKIAKELNETWASSVPKNHDLAFLPLETQEAKDYLKEMNYCLDFAYLSRIVMMTTVQEIFIEVIKEIKGKFKQHPSKFFDEIINIHHNYAVMEHHFENNVMLHRKGATSAREGQIGIIPGSQGTCSYIVKGLGNPQSFMSCSHGAGRKMGRNEARRTLVMADEVKLLEDKGILHSIWNKSDLDEAPGSYKDIDIVMANQKELVEIITKLSPLGVIKG